jgi:Leucine-rich repeat (LRR) protein
LEEYTHLRSLWLDHNHFQRLGDGLSHMSQLKCLFIQSNSLTNLNGIEQLQQLAILDVSDNRLEDTNLLGKMNLVYDGQLI